MLEIRRFLALATLSFAVCLQSCAKRSDRTASLTTISDDGFSGSSVNVISGLQNSLVSHEGWQYAAFYASDGALVAAKRPAGAETWEAVRTPFTGNVADAHNTAALAIDGDGYLHLAWDHHNNPLRYARSVAPGSLEFERLDTMTGSLERSVTYPSFLALANGDLLFLYRDGGSGRGNLVLNRYDRAARSWSQLSQKLIDGEGQRSAYVSATTDTQGGLHLAWVWRETPDVATNHDLCYARSLDGGATWETIDGTRIEMPITLANVEPALAIPQNSSLMNPPSLCIDESGAPYIANYWRPEGSDVPQYHVLYRANDSWRISRVTQRTEPFELAGAATKRPPISRSVLFADQSGLYLVYRDDELGGRIVAMRSLDLAKSLWKRTVLTTESVGAWEPSMDPAQWRRRRELHMLVQRVEQRDGSDSTPAESPPSLVQVLRWKP